MKNERPKKQVYQFIARDNDRKIKDVMECQFPFRKTGKFIDQIQADINRWLYFGWSVEIEKVWR